jgi:hypothetical protein
MNATPINKIKGPPVSGKTLTVPEAAWLTWSTESVGEPYWSSRDCAKAAVLHRSNKTDAKAKPVRWATLKPTERTFSAIPAPNYLCVT